MTRVSSHHESFRITRRMTNRKPYYLFRPGCLEQVAFYFWQHFLTFVRNYPYMVGLGVFDTAASWIGAVVFLCFNETIWYTKRTPGLGGCICISCPACCVLLV